MKIKIQRRINKLKHSLSKHKIKVQKNGKTFFVSNLVWKDYWIQRYQTGKWEPYTFPILEKFLDLNHSYIDIGSWIGPTVLYGCQLAKHCYAIEPDPVAFKELETNIKLNPSLTSRISLSNKCISNSSGIVYLTRKTEMGGDSMSSTVFKKSSKSWKVPTVTLQQFISENYVDKCNFIKMDIEGGEFTTLPNMFDFLKKEKPTLYLSLHPHLVNNPKEKLEKIFGNVSHYDYIYDSQLREIKRELIINEDTIKRSFEIIATDILLN